MAVSMPLPALITGFSKQTKARLLTAIFGNGYVQSAADGPNNIYEMITVSWDNLSATNRNTVVAALRSTLGVDYLTYTPPGDSEKKYIVIPSADTDMYSETISGGQYYTISISLRQIA